MERSAGAVLGTPQLKAGGRPRSFGAAARSRMGNALECAAYSPSVRNRGGLLDADGMTDDMIHLWILRHGESRGNTGEELDMDPPLTARGIRQARAVGRRLSRVAFDGVFLSPLRRVRQTFEALSLRAPWAEFDTRLLEYRDPGAYRLHCLPYPPTPEYARVDRHDAWERPFADRIREFLADAAALPPGRYLVVCHGGTAVGLVNDILRPPGRKRDDSIRCPLDPLLNAALAEIRLTPDRLGDRLVRWNATHP